MLKLRGSVVVEPVDVERLQATAAAAIQQWQAVRFVDGGVVDTASGCVRAGLQVADGTHPREGTAYRLFGLDPTLPATVDDHGRVVRAPEVWRVSTVEVVADRPRRLELAVRQDGSPSVRAEAQIGPRDRPDRIEASIEVHIDGRWPIRGRLRIQAHGSVDPERDTGQVAHVEATAKHPRGRGRGTVDVAATDDGRWEVTVAAEVRGRGVLRPLAAVALAVARRSVDAGFRDGLAKLAPAFVEANASMLGPDGSPRPPDELAAEMIADAIRSVPESVPDEVQRRR